MMDILTSQILSDYAKLEPNQSDTWNPLWRDGELAHRLSLLTCLIFALRRCAIHLRYLQVVDIGCGNARSTRMYLDVGLLPEQLTGIDVRPDAIALAQKLNPSIRFEVADSPKSFGNWLSLTTVMSSVRGLDQRKVLATTITESVPPGGYLFYFDLVNANTIAGGGPIEPIKLFNRLTVEWHHRFHDSTFRKPFKSLNETQSTSQSVVKSIKRLIRKASDSSSRITHESCLFRRL